MGRQCTMVRFYTRDFQYIRFIVSLCATVSDVFSVVLDEWGLIPTVVLKAFLHCCSLCRVRHHTSSGSALWKRQEWLVHCWLNNIDIGVSPRTRPVYVSCPLHFLFVFSVFNWNICCVRFRRIGLAGCIRCEITRGWNFVWKACFRIHYCSVISRQHTPKGTSIGDEEST